MNMKHKKENTVKSIEFKCFHFVNRSAKNNPCKCFCMSNSNKVFNIFVWIWIGIWIWVWCSGIFYQKNIHKSNLSFGRDTGECVRMCNFLLFFNEIRISLFIHLPFWLNAQFLIIDWNYSWIGSKVAIGEALHPTFAFFPKFPCIYSSINQIISKMHTKHPI